MSRSGQIKKDVSAGGYYFVVDVAAPGSPRRQMKRRFETYKDARAGLTKVLRDLDTGSHVASESTKLGAYLRDEWLPGIRTTVRATTWDSYERMLRHHVFGEPGRRPMLGDIPLQKLTAERLNKHYAELLESGYMGHNPARTGLSPRTVRYIHTVLHRALSDAMKRGRVARNVAALADPPRKSADPTTVETSTWTTDELRRFLEAVKDEPFFVVFHLAAMTGMRRGEVLGLRWADVDLDKSVLIVQQQLVTVNHDPRLVQVTKTRTGRRRIDLDTGTVAVLRSHRAQQNAERLMVGPGYRDHDLVFAQPDGAPWQPEYVAKRFTRRAVALGLPRLRFHDLRHTHASHLIQAGAHVKVISARLGHASTSFTMDRYGHLMPDMGSNAAAAVASLVEGGSR